MGVQSLEDLDKEFLDRVDTMFKRLKKAKKANKKRAKEQTVKRQIRQSDTHSREQLEIDFEGKTLVLERIESKTRKSGTMVKVLSNPFYNQELDDRKIFKLDQKINRALSGERWLPSAGKNWKGSQSVHKVEPGALHNVVHKASRTGVPRPKTNPRPRRLMERDPSPAY